MEQSLPHIPYVRQVFNMGYVHTSIKLIRNTQSGDSIYMYSYGIEYRNGFPRVWGPLGVRCLQYFQLFITLACLTSDCKGDTMSYILVVLSKNVDVHL